MKPGRRIFWWLIAGPLVVVATIIVVAFPFLAITVRSGAKVLVVEGWMDPGALEEAAQLARDSGYTSIYTTGTVRAFAYYLGAGEGVAVELQDPVQGVIDVDVSGSTGGGFLLLSDKDTVLNIPVTATPHIYQATLPEETKHLHVEAWSVPMEVGTPEIYVAGLLVHGMNVNFLQRDSRFTYPNGTSRPAWPTYAQSARDELIRAGIPGDRITAVPAYGKPRSRSWGNAYAFAEQARMAGITAFDVATVGVHARRSRDLFQAACGPDMVVGVISLRDPFSTKKNWWRSFRGWYTMLKELIGAPEAQALEITR